MERLWFIANLAEVLVDRDDLSLVRMHAPAGDQPPLHVHEREDEGFYLLEGSLTLWVGDDDAGACSTPAAFVARAPRNPAHLPRRPDAGAVFLVTSHPGRLRPVPARGRPPRLRNRRCPVLDGPPDIDRLARIAAAHGITLLGPPGMLPTDLVTT